MTGNPAGRVVSIAEGVRHPNGWPHHLRVVGQYEARREAAEWPASHVIGIARRSRTYRGPELPGAHLLLLFDDVEDPGDPEAPRLEHVEAATVFVDALPGDARLIVHCLQGLSRSTGMALGLLAREVAPLRAGYLLHCCRPVATPNKLLVRLWDERLGLGGELVRVGDLFPCEVWRHGDGLGNFPHRRKKGVRRGPAKPQG